jgi:adenylate cyclase
MVSQTPTILGYQFNFDTSKDLEDRVPQIPAIIVERHKQKALEYILKAKGLILNLPLIQENSFSSGFFNNIPDTSGIVRSVPLIISYNDQMYPSLALELIRASMGIKKIVINYGELGVENISLGNFEIPTDRHGRLIVNYRGGRGMFKYISAVDIYNNNFDKKDIEGKVALLGTSAAGLMDLRATPFDIVFPGVEVHANAIDNIIQGDMLTKPSDLDAFNILMIYVVTFVTVMLLIYSPFWVNPFIMILMSGLTVYFLYYKLFTEHVILEISLPIISIILATIVTTFMNYLFGVKQEKLIKNKFASKVSKNVMEQLLNDPENMKFQAMQREVTVFFSDVRGFTNISEAMPNAQTLINFMNDYMDPMTDIIMKNHGTVDKYIGDAIMAYWNAPADVKNHATFALNATLEQLHALKSLNDKIKQDPQYEAVVKMSQTNGVEPIDIGIGLNTGVAVVGEMGSSSRSDYTVIGDPINLGARLESLCKYYNSKCNISNFTKEQLKGDYIFRFLDLVTVKGKKEPIEIWQVHDWDRDENMPKLYAVSKDELLEELRLYDEAIVLYKKAKFKKALKIFKDLDEKKDKTNKNIYDIYIQRCEHYIEQPPENFDGVFKHTTKG